MYDMADALDRDWSGNTPDCESQVICRADAADPERGKSFDIGADRQNRALQSIADQQDKDTEQ